MLSPIPLFPELASHRPEARNAAASMRTWLMQLLAILADFDLPKQTVLFL
jgi:hypothetical protein